MASSSVLTVRIDPALLKALKLKAKSEGRSVSAEVVRLIKNDVEARVPLRPRRRATGMFADFESIEVEDVREVRSRARRAWLRKNRRAQR